MINRFNHLTTPLNDIISNIQDEHSVELFYILDILETNDGGYIVCGYSGDFGCVQGFLLKTDRQGKELWNKPFLIKQETIFYAFDKTNDDGYIITGTTTDAFNQTTEAILLKTDDTGNIQWMNTFLLDDISVGYSVFQKNDGGYILLGAYTNISISPNTINFLLSTNNLGDELWIKTYEEDQIFSYQKIRPADDGFLLLGAKVTQDTMASSLMKVDWNGIPLWNREVRCLNYTLAYDISILKTGECIIVGLTFEDYDHGNYHTFIMKTYPNGEEFWTHIYDNSAAISVDQTTDKGFIISGVVIQNQTQYPCLRKVNKNGYELWNKTYNNLTSGLFYTVKATSDSGFITAGNINPFNNAQGLMVKTDEQGTFQWMKVYNGPEMVKGYVKFYGWAPSLTIDHYSIHIGTAWYSCSHGRPIDYYETFYFDFCPGVYKYNISWSGKEGSDSIIGTVTIKQDEYISVCHNFTFCDDLPIIQIIKPMKKIYITNNQIFPFFTPIIIGAINITVEATDPSSAIARVEFYIDEILRFQDESPPYSFYWDSTDFGIYIIKAITYDTCGYSASDDIIVWKFF